MAGRTPQAKEIVQRIVDKEKGEVLVSGQKKELLRRQEEEEVEEEGATILRMKLQGIWKDQGSKVAHREVQRLLSFAGFDPYAKAPDIQALYGAIKQTLWEQGILPQRKKNQGSRATDEAYKAAAKKEALEALRAKLDVTPLMYNLQLDKATGKIAGCVQVGSSGDQGEHVVLGKRGQSEITLTVEE